jgi:hypothetical protein
VKSCGASDDRPPGSRPTALNDFSAGASILLTLIEP